jgi:hypothetical protein
MNLTKVFTRYTSSLLLAVVFEARAIWEYHLLPDVRVFFVGSSLAVMFVILPFLLEAASKWLDKLVKHKNTVGSVVVLLLVVLAAADFWRHNSKLWAVLNAIVGLFFLLVIWKNRLSPHSEERRLARRAKTEDLLADRNAFEKSWQRRIKIVVGIFALLFVLIAVICWRMYSNSLFVLPLIWVLAILELPCLILLFKKQIPMSDEAYEAELAKAKARCERVEARRAKLAARRAKSAERLEEQKRQRKPNSPAAESFMSFVYWSVMVAVLGFHDRPNLEKPDLVFCAMPAWHLLRAIYFFIRQQNHPKGPDAPLMSHAPAADR